jgi:hypothetical protein
METRRNVRLSRTPRLVSTIVSRLHDRGHAIEIVEPRPFGFQEPFRLASQPPIACSLIVADARLRTVAGFPNGPFLLLRPTPEKSARWRGFRRVASRASLGRRLWPIRANALHLTDWTVAADVLLKTENRTLWSANAHVRSPADNDVRSTQSASRSPSASAHNRRPSSRQRARNLHVTVTRGIVATRYAVGLQNRMCPARRRRSRRGTAR